jgi:dephospho-CoA kinase
VLRVGLTGGIGAGKSTVARALAGLGAVVVDADQLARRVVEPGSAGLAAVAGAFGREVLTADGALDRAALGSLVFADEDARAQLNAILHPRIAELTAREIAAAPADAVVVHDVPLLVENGLGANYHLVVVVTAPEAERVRRLVTDRGMSEQGVRDRMAAQAGDEARAAAADVLLDNGGEPADVVAAVERLWHERLLPFEANVRARRPAPLPGGPLLASHPGWAPAAARLAARVARAVGEAADRVDHIGPTSVPGVAARDVVDLQLVVPDHRALDAVSDALADAGFPRTEGEWHDFDVPGASAPEWLVGFLHVGADPGRPATLRVRQAMSPAWRWQLLFRDWLREHPEHHETYAEDRAAADGGAAETSELRAWRETAPFLAQGWAEATSWWPGEPGAASSNSPQRGPSTGP